MIVNVYHLLVGLSSGIVQWDFQNPEMEVPYKAIFCGDVPLHSPYMAIEYTYNNYS